MANQRDDVLELLLKAGANPNIKKEIMSLLQYAMWIGTDRAVELLLKYGAKDSEGYGALSETIYTGTVQKLKLLLNGGITISDEAAIEAVTSRNKDIHEKLKLLIAYGLDVNKKYTKDVVVEGIKEESPGVILVGPEIKTKKVSKTLLEWAKESGDPETVKILADAGAKKTDKSLLHKLKEADADLNQSYKSLASSLSEADRKKLKAEQQDWIRERDSKCGSFYKGKSIEDWLRNAAANDKRGFCVLEATKKRTTALSLRLVHKVVHPDEKVEGRSQSEWTQEYWKWSKSFPKGHQPSDDASGVLCNQKQLGPVWFLTGSSANTPVVRHCEVPAGRYIFFPVLTSLAETKPEDKVQCEQMSKLLDKMTTNITDLYVEIDKVKIPNFKLWRQTTDCFTLQTAGGMRYAASDGYWLMLKPLQPGNHTIRFRGRFLEDGFSQNVQYNLIVK